MLLGFLFGFAFFCFRGGGQYLYSENQIAKKSGEGGKLLRAPFTSYSLFQNSRGRGEQSPDEISNPPPGATGSPTFVQPDGGPGGQLLFGVARVIGFRRSPAGGRRRGVRGGT